MRIEFTARGPGGPVDVAVQAPDGTPVSQVLPALRAVVGAGPGAALWCGSRRIAGGALLGVDPSLRTGAVVDLDRPVELVTGATLLELVVVGGPRSGERHRLQRGQVVIGRDPDSAVCLAEDRVSRRHAALDVGTSGCSVRDLDSTNGTTVDAVAVDGAGTCLDYSQVIRIGDSLLRVTGPAGRTASVTQTGGSLLVNRGPRQRQDSAPGPIDFPTPPRHTPPGRIQWITALLPAIAGALMAWVLDAPAFLLFALLSPLMMMSSALGDRVHWRRSRRRDAANYSTAQAAALAAVEVGLRTELGARRDAAPDPAQIWSIADGPGQRIWERRIGDVDHLVVRLGWADQASQLACRAGGTPAPAGVVPSAPVLCDLRHGPLALAGPGDVVDGIARWVVAQLATLHPPSEVEIIALLAASGRWCHLRWLPHLTQPPGVDPGQVDATLSIVLSRLARRRADRRHAPGTWSGPWLILLIDGAVALAHAPALESVLSDGATLGITAICLADSPTTLPGACRSFAVSGPEGGSRVTVSTAAADHDAVADQVAVEWADQVARSLARLIDPSAVDGRLPESCRLTDLLGLSQDVTPQDIRSRWNAASGGARTVLGAASDGPFSLDLVADGPHALVAGTTGSGKSEMLRSLVLGLAIDHPPDQLTFVLVDYKGGAAFAGCEALPHTVGVVTDLDAQLTGRALRSLHAELRRRERAFAAVSADDLPDYRRKSAPAAIAVPRLIIVVDEFAALADELPEFVAGLVGVAQRGRSLGLHLVLATQRPGSAVSAEIRANTSLRIALRVTDPSESIDVVGAGDAAHLDPRRPGRAWVRTAKDYTSIQGGIVSGPRPDTDRSAYVEILGEWRSRPLSPGPADSSSDELATLVEITARAAALAGLGAGPSPWLPPLPDAIPAASLRIDPETEQIPIGLLDLPHRQAQIPLSVILGADGSLLLAGRAGSGRTTALVTLALGAAHAIAPDQLTIYAIDGAGVLLALLRDLPHTATALGPNSADLVSTLLERLLVQCGRADIGGRTLVLVDAWDAMLSALDDGPAAHLVDLLTRLIGSAPTDRLTVALAGGRSLLAPRMAGLFPTRLMLALSDRADYSTVGLSTRDVPTLLPPGRGVRAQDGAVFQIAHAGRSPAMSAALVDSAEVASRWLGVASDPRAVRLRPLPERVHLDEVRSRSPDHDADGVSAGMLLGVGGDAAAPCRVDVIGRHARLLVAGPPRSGKSTALHTLMIEADRLGSAIVLACPRRSPLREAVATFGARVLDPSDCVSLGPVPDKATLLLVDDCESFTDSALTDALVAWIRCSDSPLDVVVAGRSEDLATDYRGVAAQVRRHRCGLLLRPGPLDGELLGIRVPRHSYELPPGRGLMVGDPRWGPLFQTGNPIPVQVAQP